MNWCFLNAIVQGTALVILSGAVWFIFDIVRYALGGETDER